MGENTLKGLKIVQANSGFMKDLQNIAKNYNPLAAFRAAGLILAHFQGDLVKFWVENVILAEKMTEKR